MKAKLRAAANALLFWIGVAIGFIGLSGPYAELNSDQARVVVRN